MATTDRLSVPATWGASPAFTVTVDSIVTIRNTTTKHLYWATTDTDTPPTIDPGQGYHVRPSWSDKSERSFLVFAGERFWPVIPAGADTVTYDVSDAP